MSEEQVENETALRIKKLELEQQQLRFQASWRGQTIEWLKAAAGIAAILGLGLAFWSTNRQLTQLAVSGEEDRFDRAVSRLGSDNPAERLAGMSGLQLFLGPTSASKQRATLLFLVNAVAVEKDATVRAAVLDTFASVGQYRVPGQVLNEILRTARDRNRGILAILQSRFQERLQENDKALFEKGNDEAWLGKLNEGELAPLKATAATIAALIRNGAYAEDLSHIYCVACDFSSESRSVDLSRSKFDRSYLRQSKFKNVKLQRASFDAAYLTQTDFTNADLRNAKLTTPPLLDPPVQSILVQKALWAAYGPIFECADLSEADFTGSVLFGFYWTDINGAAYFPRFYGADVRGTNFKSFKLFTAVPQEVTKGRPGILGAGDDVLRLQFRQSGGYDILVKGWKESDYLIKTYEVGDNFKFTGPIPSEMWPSVYAGLNSLASAKNLSDAQMPDGLRQFLDANKAAFSRPIISTSCPTKSGLELQNPTKEGAMNLEAASKFADLRHFAEVFALISAGGFFLYKAISGYLVTNLSLKLSCVRQRIPGGKEDYVKATLTMEKGDRGTVKIHDVLGTVCTIGDMKTPIASTTFDSLGMDRRSFKQIPFGNTHRAEIIWNKLSETQPFLNLSPGEKTHVSFLATVPTGEPYVIYLVVLGQRRFSRRMAQWRASTVSLP